MGKLTNKRIKYLKIKGTPDENKEKTHQDCGQ